MRRKVAILFAALMVTSMVAMVPLGAAQSQDDDADGRASDDIQLDERLSGVVGVQGAEFDGEPESRTFGIKLAGAASEEARADVVADQLDRNENRIGELSDRQAELRQQREAGGISNGAYRAEVARGIAGDRAGSPLGPGDRPGIGGDRSGIGEDRPAFSPN